MYKKFIKYDKIQYNVKTYPFWLATTYKKPCPLIIVQMPVSVGLKDFSFFPTIIIINHVNIDWSYLSRAMSPTFRTAELYHQTLHEAVSTACKHRFGFDFEGCFQSLSCFSSQILSLSYMIFSEIPSFQYPCSVIYLKCFSFFKWLRQSYHIY